MKNSINPKAGKEARALLKFLYDIKGKYLLSGQHNYISSGSKWSEKVHEITGKIPAVWGGDFGFCFKGENPSEYHHCGAMNLTDPSEPVAITDITPESGRERLIQLVEEKHKQGFIITLMWHSCFPPDEDYCDYPDIWTWDKRPDKQTWQELTTPGTDLYSKWEKGVDKIAGYLKQLQGKKIPVLWRPYHEMNGTWFWWCNQKGKAGFAKLWKNIFRRLTEFHQLNNLIWVWNTNAPRNIPGDEAYAYEDYFPGIDFVDVLAADVYADDYKQSHHDDLLKLAEGKPIALAEVGGLPDINIIKNQPEWTWFMTWGNFITDANEPQKVKRVYDFEKVLNFDNIKNDKETNWRLQGK
ncbi:MAG: glycosyl hydrolase [Fidelibacterota bacterium]